MMNYHDKHVIIVSMYCITVIGTGEFHWNVEYYAILHVTLQMLLFHIVKIMHGRGGELFMHARECCLYVCVHRICGH